MFEFLKQRRRDRALDTHALPDALWHTTVAQLPFLQRWDATMLDRLRELSTLFLVEKNIFSGAASFEVTPEMRTLIAAQACTLILHRSMDDYTGWDNVVVHPDGFPRSEDVVDEAGVVHQSDEAIAGEAWEGGPVLLSWPDVWASTDFEATGMNLVIHEFAHKIDMLNGEIDGIPPLDDRAALQRWRAALAGDYAAFCAQVDADQPTWLDPYASEHESEFFAVCAEVYVAEPEGLQIAFPKMFKEMNGFFKLWADE
jgi:MtfA peptidase